MSDDGSRIAVVDGFYTLKVWDARTGEHLWTRENQGGFHLAFSPDGKRLATTAGTRMQLWDVANGQLTFVHPAQGAAAFSDNAKTLVSVGRDKIFRSWEAARRQPYLSLDPSNRRISQAQFRANETEMITEESGQVKVWNMENGQEVFRSDPSKGRVFSISPDGKRMAVAQAKTTTVMEIANGRTLLTLPGAPFGLAWSPDGIRHAHPVERAIAVHDADAGVSGVVIRDHHVGDKIPVQVRERHRIDMLAGGVVSDGSLQEAAGVARQHANQGVSSSSQSSDPASLATVNSVALELIGASCDVLVAAGAALACASASTWLAPMAST